MVFAQAQLSGGAVQGASWPSLERQTTQRSSKQVVQACLQFWQSPHREGSTCGQVLNPVSVRAYSFPFSVLDVWQVALLDGWLVDCIEDVEHIQVCVVVAEKVPASM